MDPPPGRGLPQAGGSSIPNAATYLQNQTGISISSGNYINTQNKSGDPNDLLPTWKKYAAETSGNAFYQNVFGIQAPKPDHLSGKGPQLPDYLQKAGAGGKRTFETMMTGGSSHSDANINYQPPFKVGGTNPLRKDSHQIDEAYRKLGNLQDLTKATSERLQRIIDQTDGGDLDLNKVERHLKKNNASMDFFNQGKPEPSPPAPKGFVTGL
jgi:hypothetical protein